MEFFQKILDMVLPRSCAGCGASGEDFCLACRASAKPPRDEAFAAPWLISLWSYREERVRMAVRSLKYRGRKPIAKIFAEALYDKLLEDLAEKEMFSGEIFEVLGSGTYLLVPIPLSRARMQKRGFNQSELIAREIARISSGAFLLETGILKRVKNTEHQTLLKNREERVKNLAGSFAAAKPDAVRGQIIILIDDVATTGATLMGARGVLLAAGAKRVYAATVAH